MTPHSVAGYLRRLNAVLGLLAKPALLPRQNNVSEGVHGGSGNPVRVSATICMEPADEVFARHVDLLEAFLDELKVFRIADGELPLD